MIQITTISDTIVFVRERDIVSVEDCGDRVAVTFTNGAINAKHDELPTLKQIIATS